MVFSILTAHSNVIGLLFAACTEIFGTVRASNAEFSHMFSCLTGHTFSSLVFGRIIWLRWLKAKNFITTRTLDNSIRVLHHHFCLLLSNVLEPFRAEGFPQILCLHNRVTLAAPAVVKVTRWLLGQKLLFGVRPETICVELVKAPFR